MSENLDLNNTNNSNEGDVTMLNKLNENNTNEGVDNMKDLVKLINGVSVFLKEVEGISSLEEQAVQQLGKVLADSLGLAKETEVKDVIKETVVEVPVEVVVEKVVEVPVEVIKEDTSKLEELQAKITEQEGIIEQLAECLETSNTVIEQQKADLEEATRLMQFALDEINELNKLQIEEPSDSEIADFEDDDDSEIDTIQNDLEQQSDELDNGNNDEDMVHSECESAEIDTDDDILGFIIESESKPVEELSFEDEPVQEQPKPKARTKRNTGFKSNSFEEVQQLSLIQEDTSNNDDIFEKQLSHMNVIDEDTSDSEFTLGCINTTRSSRRNTGFSNNNKRTNVTNETSLESNNVPTVKQRKTTRKQSQYDQYGNPRESRKISSETPNDTTTAMAYLKRIKSNEITFEYVLANRTEFEDMCTLWLSINMNQLPKEISDIKIELFKHDLENTNLD